MRKKRRCYQCGFSKGGKARSSLTGNNWKQYRYGEPKGKKKGTKIIASQKRR